MNFDKPPVQQEKNENTLEGNPTNWEKSKKYLRMLALSGFISLSSFSGNAQEQKTLEESREDLRDQIENLETIWKGQGSEIDSEKPALSFINESDLFLNADSTKNREVLEKIKISFEKVFNTIEVIPGVNHTDYDNSETFVNNDRGNFKNEIVTRDPDRIDDVNEYTRPDYYIVFDDVQENDVDVQENDAFNIKVINLETGDFKEVAISKNNLKENINTLPEGFYEQVAEQIKIKLDLLGY